MLPEIKTRYFHPRKIIVWHGFWTTVKNLLSSKFNKARAFSEWHCVIDLLSIRYVGICKLTIISFFWVGTHRYWFLCHSHLQMAFTVRPPPRVTRVWSSHMKHHYCKNEWRLLRHFPSVAGSLKWCACRKVCAGGVYLSWRTGFHIFTSNFCNWWTSNWRRTRNFCRQINCSFIFLDFTFYHLNSL